MASPEKHGKHKSKHRHKHKKHKSKHKHKKSHRRADSPGTEDKPIDQLAVAVVEKSLETLKNKGAADGPTLELVMTEQLLSQLEASELHSDQSDSSKEETLGGPVNSAPSDSEPAVSSTTKEGSKFTNETLSESTNGKALNSPKSSPADKSADIADTERKVIKRSLSRSASPSHSVRKKRRSRSRSNSRTRRRSNSRTRRRSNSRTRRRSNSRTRRRSNSRTRRRSNSRTRRRSRGRTGNRRRSRSRSRDRRRSVSRDRRRGRSGSRGYRRRSRSHRRSPRRRSHRRRSRSLSTSSSESRSSSRSKSREKEPPVDENEPNKLYITQTVSDMARQFGHIRRQLEINKLTSICAQITEDQEEENKGATTKPTKKLVRAPFDVTARPPTMVFENNTWKTSSQLVYEASVAVATRPVEEVFPVSTGVEHAQTDGDIKKQSESLPISDLVAKRLECTQRLQQNQFDQEAQLALASIDQQMGQWAQGGGKQGKYTGKQMLNALSHDVHKTGYQTWAKKHMFHGLPPVIGGFGLKMLKKMGWVEGNPLGVQGCGQVEPLALDVKTDRTGLKTTADKATNLVAPVVSSGKSKQISFSDLAQHKHPVSALQEICQKRHWPLPGYESVTVGTGFVCKVVLPIGSYTPTVAKDTKKEAKVSAAAAALHGLGLTDKTVEYTYSALS